MYTYFRVSVYQSLHLDLFTFLILLISYYINSDLSVKAFEVTMDRRQVPSCVRAVDKMHGISPTTANANMPYPNTFLRAKKMSE